MKLPDPTLQSDVLVDVGIHGAPAPAAASAIGKDSSVVSMSMAVENFAVGDEASVILWPEMQCLKIGYIGTAYQDVVYENHLNRNFGELQRILQSRP